MSIIQWPTNERPREKLINQGASSLSDAELLAIFLRTGVRGKSAVDLARDLLNDYGGLRHLLETNSEQFCAKRGLGLAKYAQLQAALEMSRRYLFAHLQRKDVISSPNDTRRFLISQLRAQRQEVFACLFLDTRHRVIAYEELFHGGLDQTTVYPREVAKKVLEHNAAAVIFAHNHPSGSTEASQADLLLTRQLTAALELLQIRVLDHFIIGEGEPVSFAEKGLL